MEKKYIVLGVAFEWGKKKGLDVFLQIASQLGPEYQIVLVGIKDRNKANIPDSIVTINRTNNQIELAQLYSAADVFVNPTREDNFPTVNMEAIACGTPVITFNVGGCPEAVSELTGKVIECDDVKNMIMAIKDVVADKSFYHNNCLLHSKEFDMNNTYHKYIHLYEACKNE